jgi:2,4-diaminopentanoate dehydrogenase
MEKVKALVYGAGTVGKDIARFMLEKGVIITDAVDITHVGEDLGDVLGLDRKLNVCIRDDVDAVLAETGADIALMALATSMDIIYPHVKKCLEAGLNVITTSEEASYPWTASPTVTAKLDRIAKENGVTVTGSGMQDIFWATIVTHLTGASQRIDAIEGQVSVNVDALGEMVAGFYAVGRKLDEIQAMIDAGEKFPIGDEVDFLRMDLENQIAELGLTPKAFRKIVTPLTRDHAVPCRSRGTMIPPGDVIGLDITIEIDTAEGILFKGTMTGRAYDEGEVDFNEWYIRGVPEIHMRNDNPPTLLGTSSQIVNRIPDVINAPPGFVTIDRLPKLICKVRSLEHYIW